MKEVILDQRPASGQVWIRIVWQIGAVSEHQIRRNVNSYRNYANIATLESRVRDLVTVQKVDHEIATVLNAEGLLSVHTDDRSAAMRFICCANAGTCQP
jgi:hypothetical protein